MMRLFKSITTILCLFVLVMPVSGQELLGRTKLQLENLFVEGNNDVIQVQERGNKLSVVLDKRDQRNMKHHINYLFSFEKQRVIDYSIEYPCNSFMEEEISMLLSMNEEKTPLSQKLVTIDGSQYNHRYCWDTDVLLSICKEKETIVLSFSKSSQIDKSPL